MSVIRDLYHYKNNSPSQSLFGVLINPCFYALVNYRIGHFLFKKKIPIIPKIFWLITRIFFSMDIDYRAVLGEKVMFIHGIGMVIGKNTIIGNNIKIYQGVTIGGTGKKRKDENGAFFTQPIIDSDIVIYTNSCILGPVYVGKNVKIGAGSIVLKDIQPNTVFVNKNK